VFHAFHDPNDPSEWAHANVRGAARVEYAVDGLRWHGAPQFAVMVGQWSSVVAQFLVSRYHR